MASYDYKKLLLGTIKKIEKAGDGDEASYKHVLHGLTALYHLGSSRKRADYCSPGRGKTEDAMQPYWSTITGIFNNVGKDEFEQLLEGSDYNCHYRMDCYNTA